MAVILPAVLTIVNATSGFVENPDWQKQLFQPQRDSAAVIRVDGDNSSFTFSQMNSSTNLMITRVNLRDIKLLNPVKKPYPLEYWLTPGEYQLTVRCQAWRDNREVMAEGTAKATLQLGKEYVIKVISSPANAKDWNSFGACLPSVVERTAKTSTDGNKTAP